VNHDATIAPSTHARTAGPTKSPGRRLGLVAVAISCVLGCHDPDPRSVEGALDAAARALEARDGRALFRVVDQRARHALASIVKDRREAARVVRDTHPEPERARALAALGDAAEAADAPALFAARCDEPCMAALAAKIGAPTERTTEGDELVVRTSRGETLRLHHGSDGWWGIVWRTEALGAERDRAAQDLRQIRENAEIYRRRRVLEAADN